MTDQMWARGATAPVTLPPAPAPPAPPTYFPPTAEGGRPGRGPRSRFPRWIAGIAVLVVVAAAGVGGGWALRGANAPTSAAPTPSAQAPTGVSTFNPDQARARACDGFATIGTQWSAAYVQWLPNVSGPNWRWDDPTVKAATDRFAATESQVVTEINALVAPNTPADVAAAINAYTSAILAFAATHGTADGPQMSAKIDTIDAAVVSARQVCGLPPG